MVQNTTSLKMSLQDSYPLTSVTVSVTTHAVVLAYCNKAGQALDVREFSTREHPELKTIVRLDTFSQPEWDIEMVLFLLDEVEGDQPAPALMPLVPAYLQSLQVAS